MGRESHALVCPSSVLYCIVVTKVLVGKMDVGSYSPTNYKSWRKTKSLKDMESKCIFLLGRDIYMDKVEALCSRELVGCLEYCKIGKEEWVVWEAQH